MSKRSRRRKMRIASWVTGLAILLIALWRWDATGYPFPGDLEKTYQQSKLHLNPIEKFVIKLRLAKYKRQVKRLGS